MQNNRLERKETAFLENLCFYRTKDYQRERTLCADALAHTCICVRTYARVCTDATQADREQRRRARNLRFPFCKPSRMIQETRPKTDDFLILKKRKRTKKKKREKNKLTNNYLILKLKKNIIYYIYFSRFCG